jgi:quinol monooxygenase YgiN
MASVFAKLRVADFDTWKREFDANEANRRASGMTSHSVHRDAADPNAVVIAFRVDDIAKAREFFTSPDLRAVMEKAGVQGPPEFWFADDVEDKTY